jgi:hypothetical protein
MSSELVVDGVRRPDPPLPVRRADLTDDEPEDEPPFIDDLRPPTLRVAA